MRENPFLHDSTAQYRRVKSLAEKALGESRWTDSLTSDGEELEQDRDGRQL